MITSRASLASPRSTGLGSVEAVFSRDNPPRRPGRHPGLRAWAPLKLADRERTLPLMPGSPRSTGLGSVEAAASMASACPASQSPRSTGLGSVEAPPTRTTTATISCHPGLRAWAPLKRRAAHEVRLGLAESPRSTGLGSVEAARWTARRTRPSCHPGLRAWAPLKRGEMRGANTGTLDGHPGLRAWAPLKHASLIPVAQGLGRHPGLRAWAPLKREREEADMSAAERVTQVYGPGLR